MSFRKHLLLAIVLLVAFLAFFPKSAQAAQLTEAYVRLDRLKASTITGGTVCAKITTTGSTDATIKVSFPSGFTVDSTAGN